MNVSQGVINHPVVCAVVFSSGILVVNLDDLELRGRNVERNLKIDQVLLREQQGGIHTMVWQRICSNSDGNITRDNVRALHGELSLPTK